MKSKAEDKELQTVNVQQCECWKSEKERGRCRRCGQEDELKTFYSYNNLLICIPYFAVVSVKMQGVTGSIFCSKYSVFLYILYLCVCD